ncbi:MAG TPA: phytoene/squalene synthase family protein [Azospirillaceae bacterium]|nr:phytoene/squalene synthase family protein [Azospirillaceae bacterium]
MATAADGLSYSGQQVRRYDNDRFLTALFAPADRREDLFALYAFNLEIAKTREVVTEAMLGRIRLQWWREAIAALYGENGGVSIDQNEVLRPLADAIGRHGLSREYFERLIDAREADLDEEPPASLACLANYAEVTSAPLVLLGLEVLGVRDGVTVEAGRNVGVAWALTGLLRAVPFHASQRRLYLPADRLVHHGVRAGRVLDLKPEPELKPVIREVTEMARHRLAQARSRHREVPRAALPALLSATLADSYLDALAREDYDVFAPRVRMPHPFRQARLAWWAMRGRY